MTAVPEFARFADLLLASVPSLAAEAIERAHARLQSGSLAHAVAGDRQHTATVLQGTRPGVRGVAASFSAALRQQLREEVARAPAVAARRDTAHARPSLDSLTLVDDQQVEEDIEVARVIQLVDTAAEADLRELRSLCATMRGATELSPELHPMRPEVCARALVRALHELDWPRDARRLALRAIGGCLVEGLQQRYGDQLRELRRWGVQPLPYRVRLSEEPALTARDDEAMRKLAALAPGDAMQAAQQLIPRLLHQVAEQGQLGEPLVTLLGRLAGPAIRSIRSGGGLLSSFEHPVWRLVDRVAAVASVQSGGSAAGSRLAARLEPVITRLERMQAVTPMAFEQALADVEDLASEWADAQLSDAGVLSAPSAGDAGGGSLPTDWGGASLPTVPMALGTEPAQALLQQWWSALREGQLLRVFLHARWCTLRVTGCTRTHVLLGAREGPALHTLSRRALLLLREQGLATMIDTPQPVRQAVDTLTLDLDASA